MKANVKDNSKLFENLELLSVYDVAKWLGKAPQTIRNMAALKRIPYIPGRPMMFRKKSLEAWLDRKEIKPWR